MRAKYYVIPECIANELGLTPYRRHNENMEYLVNSGDLVVYGIEKAVDEGARELTVEEAKSFIKKAT